MPSSTPGATDLPPASKVEDVQASSLVEEDAKPQDTCKPAANEGNPHSCRNLFSYILELFLNFLVF